MSPSIRHLARHLCSCCPACSPQPGFTVVCIQFTTNPPSFKAFTWALITSSADILGDHLLGEYCLLSSCKRERNSWELRGHERTDTNHHQPATSDVNTVNSAFCCRNYTAALVLILLQLLFIAIRMGVLWYSCDENIKKIFGRWNRWVKLHQGC